ncbi:ThuA domain-containing protein [Lacihabitans sp. CS3-21]|uniref:ThuA domain-containing protein n=1 Tax=Lacihabitans sp. CS3-21 TaxID=2487332 RepID=UPI0020CC0A30|nr:ThuA domain-containing protein [Lacihabitans sp. CS3-21]MCP9747375.1 carbohydrate-binding protein [Lacihabitans sp. CS3-21]
MSKKFNLFLLTAFTSFQLFAQDNSVLVFSKTAGFRHVSIKEGREFFENLGKTNGFKVVLSENSDEFNEENLKKFNAVVFLNTTGDVLNPAQQADFERYIQSGGGYLGIHAASDTEYNWPWYNDLMGGYFASHPGRNVSNVQNGKMMVIDRNHPSTAHLPETFEREDEFYDFKSLKTDKLKFLVKVDEKSYKEGKMGDFHPMSWYHEYDGGKSFYSNFGHTPATFSEPLMTKHLSEGLKWAWASKLDYTKVKTQRAPEENRFIKTTLVKNLDEPTELAVMPNGKVIFVERKGAIKLWNPKTKETKLVGQLNVYKKFEYGLMGVSLDPNFVNNNWLYFYYSPETDQHKDNFLSRFTYDQNTDTVLISTEKIVLRVHAKRDECCHTGGSIDWDAKGNLFLSTGDDTNPFASDGYAPIDFREGRQGWDALSTSGNTNDLRGKILRIHPENDGTYTIPEGNLFPNGMEKTRPEIYVMGNRNPYRISVDKKTGFLYWGEIGPDAGKSNPERGPEGYVEFNQARKPGFFGWPIFAGNNTPYRAYDFETKKSGELFDPLKPVNLSPHNTGLKNLPPTQKPMIWYGYGDSKEFPLMEKGGANPMGGPVYHSEEYQNSDGKFPNYFDNKFFAYEWMRDWIVAVTLDKDGNYAGMERFMPNTKFYHPMDMAFGQNGVLYTLEYGMNWFAQNEEAQLSMIEYNAGNRKPVVKVKASVTEGAAPLTVKFSTEGTLDYDNDKIYFDWTFGKSIPNSKLANPSVVFTKPGIYDVNLLVKDSEGNENNEIVKIKVGNAVPVVDIKIKSNKSFVLDETIDYEVKVYDKEDGSLIRGINPEDVMVSINYLEGYDKTVLEQGHKSNESFMTGKRHIEKSDCAACHSKDKKSIGPSYYDIADKYPKNATNITILANKIISGGGGVWGEQAMAAHPQLGQTEAKEIVDYILSIKDPKATSKPISGSFKANDHKTKKEGAYIIQASYTDKGGKVIGSITNSKSVAIKTPILSAQAYDKTENTQKFSVAPIGDLLIANHNSFGEYEKIDLTGISKISISAFSQAGQSVGGSIEIRLGSATGLLIGSTIISAGNMLPKEVTLPKAFAKTEDIFFVFKNENAEGKPLFGISKIEFKK